MVTDRKACYGLMACHPYSHATQIQLENVFVKNYAPNHKLAPKDNRGIIKSLRNLSKNWSGHLHHISKLYAWYHDPAQTPVILFTS